MGKRTMAGAKKRAATAAGQNSKHIGQSASEYTTILAAVLIIALLAIFILNSAGSVSASQSPYKSYWSTLTPFSISDVIQTGTSQVTFLVQNTESRELTMTRVVLTTSDGARSFVNDSTLAFMPGQKRLVIIHPDSSSSVANCDNAVGNYPNKYSVFISYDLDSIGGKSFNSTNKLLPALCLPAVPSEAPPCGPGPCSPPSPS